MILSAAGTAPLAAADTLEGRFPGLVQGLLASARLEAMDDELLLQADGFKIVRTEIADSIKGQDPKLRRQLEKNLLFVLDQEATGKLLLNEARKAGIKVDGGDDNQAIQAFFEHKTKEISVSEEESRAFYQANKDMFGGAPFEQIAGSIRQYLLQEKKQQAVEVYINKLGDSAQLRLNEKWTDAQGKLSMDNPVDKARQSGKPTLVEFGATGCVPCDMMQPILDNLRKDYPEKLNVVFVHVGEEQILGARFGIRSIPVQVFYDAKGKEVLRHVGFFAQTEMDRQLAQMGVAK